MNALYVSGVLCNRFKYHHMGVYHNKRIHDPISIEECWAIKTWSNRLIALLVAISKVHSHLVARRFNGKAYCNSVSSSIRNIIIL
jgi:hypothetical protein